jgi:hypothetical protein
MGDDVNRLCTIALAVLVLGTGGLPASTDGGLAQAAERGKAKARKGGGNGKASPSRSRKTPAPRATEPAPAEPPADGGDTPAGSTTAAASEPASGARSGKPRVYTFGGLDLEGKLKTPQLLYFRGRMRQELDASSLQRRSFLKELEKTADDQGL